MLATATIAVRSVGTQSAAWRRRTEYREGVSASVDLGLKDKRVLITGGTRGIGLAAAQAFASEGAQPVLAARDPELLADAARAIRMAAGVRAETHVSDLSVAGAAEDLAEAVGDVDVLVNNAGAIPAGDIAGVDEARWREAWDLKVFGYINLCRAYYARMQLRGGVIVNVIGTGGERHDPAYIAGVTANAGLMAMTRALGAAGPAVGVRVVGVNPGLTRTDRLERQARRRATAAGRGPDRWREGLPALPFGRPAEPEEVADVVTYLASMRASYVSGTVVTVDGGHSVAR